MPESTHSNVHQAAELLAAEVRSIDDLVAQLAERRFAVCWALTTVNELIAQFPGVEGSAPSAPVTIVDTVGSVAGVSTVGEGPVPPPVPSPAPPTKKRPKTPPAAKTSPAVKWDYVEIAGVITEALGAGRSPRQAIAARYEVNPAMASYLLKACKARGLVLLTGFGQSRSVPTREKIETVDLGAPSVMIDSASVPVPVSLQVVPTPPAPTPASKAGVRQVLMCSECDFEVEPHKAPDLIRHCLQVHKRRPTNAERTPVKARGGAA